MKTALVLVDIQNDYFPGGRHELVSPEKAGARASVVLNVFRRRNWPVFHIRHISTRPGASFFLPDTPGAEIHSSVCPVEGEEIIIKHLPDSFLGTGLKERLEARGVDTLVICGMMTHMCIDTTVRAAAGIGYPVVLLEDACATGALEWNGMSVPAELVQGAYMAALSGTFARVLKVDDWLREYSSEN